MGIQVIFGASGQMQAYERHVTRILEQAALRASDLAARGAQQVLQASMRGAGLGKLGGAIGSGSDRRKGRGVHAQGRGFSASGWVYARGRSERTQGALESYLRGAEITPKKGPFLWIATRELQRIVGRGSERRRMTPALYRKHGLERRIGPLIEIPGRHGGERLLVVRNVSVDRFGRTGGRHGPRRLPRRLGGARAKAEQVVLFVGILHTSQTARVNPDDIFRDAAAALPRLVGEEVRALTR